MLKSGFHGLVRAAKVLFIPTVLLVFGCTNEPTPSPSPVTSLPTETITTTSTTATPTLSPSPSPQPTRLPLPEGLIQMMVPALAEETADALRVAEHPPVDYYRIVKELLDVNADSLTPEASDEPDWQVNDRADFFVKVRPGGFEYKKLPARLRYLSENVAWWTAVKTNVSDEDIASAAQRFEEEQLQINRLLFGNEWSPGIDHDPRIHILLVDEPVWGGTFGYFSSLNEYPITVFPFSNQKEMITVNLSSTRLGSETFFGQLGHEYQHLIQWYKDPNQDLWLNEAMSELAYFLSGAPPASSAFALTNSETFAEYPEIQLTSRPERKYGDEDLADYAHYGAERLFAVYLFEQYGARFIKDVVENPSPGVFSIQQELDQLEEQPPFEEVFANWLLANLLNQPNLLEGKFGYQNIRPNLPKREEVSTFKGDPVGDKLPPYGARYYEIQSDDDVQVNFSGSTLARLTPADPPSGEYAWYSNRGDESEFSLSRSFDLTGVNSATLNYKVWYELEEFYDYAYVQVSANGGESWTNLTTAYGTDQNPYQNAYGHGYSGTNLEWQVESLDLSPYAGQVVQLRFVTMTDLSRNRDGMQLDDIEIPEIGYFDGAEDDSGGWEARGFVRSSNLVPVEWIVWLLKLGIPTQVERIEMNLTQEAEFSIAGFGREFPFAAVVVAPTAPVTTMEVDYELVFEHR